MLWLSALKFFPNSARSLNIWRDRHLSKRGRGRRFKLAPNSNRHWVAATKSFIVQRYRNWIRLSSLLSSWPGLKRSWMARISPALQAFPQFWCARSWAGPFSTPGFSPSAEFFSKMLSRRMLIFSREWQDQRNFTFVALYPDVRDQNKSNYRVGWGME